MSHQNQQDQINTNNDNNKERKIAKVFDWIKAAKLIKECHIQNASIGYDQSTYETFIILKNGKPVLNNNDKMQLGADDDKANPILIDKDRGEIMNRFIVIDISDQANSVIIHSFKSGKREILLRWPKEALDIIDRHFYRKGIQESK